ncbi:hypothetical protein [Vibrio sonorensis]|uniref:hypothetical protein n=1 Tax=Vibrio sonorensis TaxID=1004316 RepID=UPI0008DB0080|nr:hypothetical protein [Vibrio sonorensis]
MLDDVRSTWTTPIVEWEATKESFDYFYASGKLESLLESDVDSLFAFLIKHRDWQDSYTIKVSYEFEESVEFSNRTSQDVLDERLEELRDCIENLDDDEQHLTVEVEVFKKLKEVGDNVLVDNIYSIDAWSNYLDSLSIEELHHNIHRRYHRAGIEGVVLVGDYTEACSTDYFHFIPRVEFSHRLLKVTLSKKRVDDLLKLRSNLGHFANAAEWQFLPEHFKFNGAVPADIELVKAFFNALHNVYLISFLANFTIINNGKVEYTLKGFKDIVGEYDLPTLINSDASALWSLYQWIYQSNSVDKIGITRNVIPLHVEELLKVNDAVITSAYSGFNLSQKDDVKSYINATNKLAEQVQATTQKASEVAEKVANSIKTGVFGLATFAISTILFRIFSKGADIHSYSDLFAFIGSPLFVSMIAFALIIFSALFGLALFESIQDQARFKEMYEQSKKTYENVLTTQDMANILSDDEYFKKNNLFISGRRRLYIWVWAGVLSVISATLIFASYSGLNISG